MDKMAHIFVAAGKRFAFVPCIDAASEEKLLLTISLREQPPLVNYLHWELR